MVKVNETGLMLDNIRNIPPKFNKNSEICGFLS